jgi:hypothetical protein
MAMKDNPDVCKYLVETLKKEGRRSESIGPLMPVIKVLLASSAPNASADALGFLDKAASTNPEVLAILLETADELGKRAVPSEFAQLEALAASQTFEREFGLRRAVMDAATHYKSKEAVGFVLRLLEKEKGELRGPMIEYLELVTGENFGVNAPAWLKWWNEHQQTFQYPQKLVLPSVRSVAKKNAGNSYYGIPIYAKRMVFVLDTSNSMRGERIVAAKRDLIGVVKGLDEDCYFGLVAFNSGVYVWQKTLMPANSQSKQMAEYWITAQQLAVRTASFDALEAAMLFDAEAIFFLTDGAPAGGRIDDPTEIVRTIGLQNRLKRESIYSIGVGLGRAGNKHESFLKSLTTGNYGIYRRVEE